MTSSGQRLFLAAKMSGVWMRPLALVLLTAVAVSGCSGATSTLSGITEPTPRPVVDAKPKKNKSDSFFDNTDDDDEDGSGGKKSKASSQPTTLLSSTPRTTKKGNYRFTNTPAAQDTYLSLTAEDDDEDASAAVTEVPVMPDMGESREETVNELRAKADATGKNKPSPYPTRTSNVKRLSKEKLKSAKDKMSAAVAENEAAITEEEAAALEERRKLLRQQAQRHYKDAVKSIQN